MLSVAGARIAQLGGFTELEQQLAADSPDVVVQVLSEAVVNKPIMLGRAKDNRPEMLSEMPADSALNVELGVIANRCLDVSLKFLSGRRVI